MVSPQPFQGFPKESIKFYTELSRNNHKSWFDTHKKDYNAYVLEPTKDFVAAMGTELRKLSKGFHADPKVNKSIFRIYRDVRFSRDKTPYKNHLALWFWEGGSPRMECSGFYVHIEPGRLMLGAGIYQFSKNLLIEYRESIVNAAVGTRLDSAVKKVSEKRNYSLGGRHYKKVPRGYDPKYPLADYLLFNGFYLGIDMTLPDELYTPGFPDFCLPYFKEMLPVHQWLFEMTERAPK